MIRRLFMRNAPMGAVAAGVIARDVAAKEANWVKPPENSYHPGLAGADTASGLLNKITHDPLYAIRQAKRIEFNKSMNALDRIHNTKRYRRNHVENLDLNIESLRSVSRQHKAHMQFYLMLTMEEEKKSLMDMLLIKLGLSKDDAGYYDGGAQVSAPSPRY